MMATKTYGGDSTTFSIYAVGSPNGLKVPIALEELIASGSDITYTAHRLDMGASEQKSPSYLAVNPNGKIPALIDNVRFGDEALAVWESGSILAYLEQHYDPNHALGFPNESREQAEMTSWSHYAVTALGPASNEAGHFLGAEVHDLYAVKRALAELHRIYATYERRLAENGERTYLVGERFSSADLLAFVWVRGHNWSPALPSLAEAGYPHLEEWVKRCEERPAFKKVTAPGTDMFTAMKSKPDWREIASKRGEWVRAPEDK